MLCEGSPLLFYTPWGPVTPMGMYRGARRLTQSRGADRRAPGSELINSSCPRLSRPVYGSLPRQSSSVYGSWPRQSSPVNCSCPGHILYSRMLCEGSPLLFYTPWGPVTPMGMYRGARRLSQRTGESRGVPVSDSIYSSCPRLSRPV